MRLWRTDLRDGRPDVLHHYERRILIDLTDSYHLSPVTVTKMVVQRVTP